MSLPVDDLLSYLSASPTPFHAVAAAQARLDAGGFRELKETDSWSKSSVRSRRYVIRGGALIAWDATGGRDPITDGFRIVGAHTDSPNLRLKPNPETTSAGYQQLAVEIYGGALNNSWLDRDLGVAGRIVSREGEVTLVNIDRPIARVSQLAIHLDREVNDRGLVLDKQLHMAPMVGIGTYESGGFMAFVAKHARVPADQIVSHDLMLFDLTRPAIIGMADEFIASARIDNLFSAWAAISALAGVSFAEHGSSTKRKSKQASKAVAMIALFDHEEVGSGTTTGAAGPLLQDIVERVIAHFDDSVEGRARALRSSACVSADMAHAVHPNYADRHDPSHRPLPNGGPVIKVNANQRYATDALTAALFSRACATAEVPVQNFVSRNSQPCGSTIGPITATRLGVGTVDVGCAMLSMHSARELCGAHDAELFVRALSMFFRQPA